MRPVSAALLLTAVLVFLPSTQAQTFTVLHSFQSTDGSSPQAAVIQDNSGNLYGTTLLGGSADAGVVFKISPKDKFSILHNFGVTASDGFEPASPLLLDNYGNLYGTTIAGGVDCYDGVYTFGCGTVFKINATGRESVIHAFAGGDPASTDGMNPFSGLVADSRSNAMYGTTWGGFNGSVAYQIMPNGKETILYTLTNPTLYGPLVEDANGDLWGASGGGNDHLCDGGCGTVFKLHRTSSGWVETITYTFTGKADGANPWAGLVYDGVHHVFYGITELGGASQTCDYQGSPAGCGVLFKLDSTGTKLTVLHTFAGKADGQFPIANLILDPLGDVYGATSFGGPNTAGTVFVYTAWGQFMTLHNFTGGADGANPAGLLLDRRKAVLYGTTSSGGDPTCDCGVVFSLAP